MFFSLSSSYIVVKFTSCYKFITSYPTWYYSSEINIYNLRSVVTKKRCNLLSRVMHNLFFIQFHFRHAMLACALHKFIHALFSVISLLYVCTVCVRDLWMIQNFSNNLSIHLQNLSPFVFRQYLGTDPQFEIYIQSRKYLPCLQHIRLNLL